MSTARNAPATPGDILFTPAEELAAYRSMLLIRRFEEKVGQLYALGEISGACPLSIGQEASIVGATMAASPADCVIAGSRSHGHMLALGVDASQIMSELMGRANGISQGRGGTFHMFAPEENFFGGHRTPGLSASLGAGLAFAGRYRGSDAVCLCFMSVAAASKGRVAETYRIAAEWKLPIVFLIDNSAGAPGSSVVLGTLPSAMAQGGMPFAIPGEQVDGIDVRKARAAARRAIERARRGEGPTILEMLTYRYRGHAAPGEVRTPEKRRDETDPIAKSRARILGDRVAAEADLKAIEKNARDRVNAAAAAARSAPRPGPDKLHTLLVP